VLLLQEALAEETRQKLSALGRLRQADEDRGGLAEMLEEESEAKRAVERQASSLHMQVWFMASVRFFPNAAKCIR